MPFEPQPDDVGGEVVGQRGPQTESVERDPEAAQEDPDADGADEDEAKGDGGGSAPGGPELRELGHERSTRRAIFAGAGQPGVDSSAGEGRAEDSELLAPPPIT